MSSKQRRAIKRVPATEGDPYGAKQDKAWGTYFERLERTLQNTQTPWRERYNEIDSVTPDLESLETQLQAFETLTSQGYASDALAVAHQTLARIVEAWRTVAELPKQAPKHRDALYELERQYIRERAEFLTAAPTVGRLWITDVVTQTPTYTPPYVVERPFIRDETPREVETVQVDVMGWLYDEWRNAGGKGFVDALARHNEAIQVNIV